jgi:DNA-binding MltR family transcriptional regulator
MRTTESRPTPAAADGRKQAVSIRLNATDLRNVKKLAKRLHVRYSDIIRYAVKTSLAKLGPLLDGDVRGRSLVPVLVETGTDLVRYLDLDAAQLEAIRALLGQQGADIINGLAETRAGMQSELANLATVLDEKIDSMNAQQRAEAQARFASVQQIIGKL